MKRVWSFVFAGALAISMATPAMAKEHGRDRDHHSAPQWREHGERGRGDHYRDYRHARWNDHDRDDRRPAGWDRGHKTGWRGGSLPPGQAKKHHDYDRDDWARSRRRHHRHHETYARGPIVNPRNTSYPTRPYPTRTYPNRTTEHGRGPIPVPSTAGTTTTAQKPSGHGPIAVPGR